MVDSFVGVRASSTAFLESREISRITEKKINFLDIKFLIPVSLLLFAFCIAPDTPNQLASICEKHNSELACQKW